MPEKYSDQAKFSRPEEEPFDSPKGVKRFAGYGANEADLARGYEVPAIANAPEYDLVNYRQKWTEPKLSDQDDVDGPFGMVSKDFEFRQKDRESRGFLTRPYLPTGR